MVEQQQSRQSNVAVAAPSAFRTSHRRVLFSRKHTKHVRLVLLPAPDIYDEKHCAFLAAAAAKQYVSSLRISPPFPAPPCSLVRSAYAHTVGQNKLPSPPHTSQEVFAAFTDLTIHAHIYSFDFHSILHSKLRAAKQAWKPSSRLRKRIRLNPKSSAHVSIG